MEIWRFSIFQWFFFLWISKISELHCRVAICSHVWRKNSLHLAIVCTKAFKGGDLGEAKDRKVQPRRPLENGIQHGDDGIDGFSPSLSLFLVIFLVGGFKQLDYFPFHIWDSPNPIDYFSRWLFFAAPSSFTLGPHTIFSEPPKNSNGCYI